MSDTTTPTEWTPFTPPREIVIDPPPIRVRPDTARNTRNAMAVARRVLDDPEGTVALALPRHVAESLAAELQKALNPGTSA